MQFKLWVNLALIELFLIPDLGAATIKSLSVLRQRLAKSDPETLMTAPEIIRNRGYPVEVHRLMTDDGYILEMHRIPRGRSPDRQADRPVRPVVFVQHGLLCSSTDYIMSPVEKGLGYMLADAGYDVWLGNIRGNTYSRKHLYLNANKDPAFWDFSFDEIGKYDIPAQLRYILEMTGQRQINYVGHSMGALTFWIAMETNPDLNDRIRIMFGIGPVGTTANMKSPIKFLAPFAEDFEWILNNLGIYEFLPNTALMQLLGKSVCKDSNPKQPICSNSLFLIAGYDPSGLNTTMLPLIVSHTPAGTSMRNIVHFAQEFNNKNYAHYDFGVLENLIRYGQTEPPLYHLSAVKVPVVLMWSQNDLLADPKDVAWLASHLPNLRLNYRVPKTSFSHLDFLYAVDADVLVYEKILEILRMDSPTY